MSDKELRILIATSVKGKEKVEVYGNRRHQVLKQEKVLCSTWADPFSISTTHWQYKMLDRMELATRTKHVILRSDVNFLQREMVRVRIRSSRWPLISRSSRWPLISRSSRCFLDTYLRFLYWVISARIFSTFCVGEVACLCSVICMGAFVLLGFRRFSNARPTGCTNGS